MNGSHRFHLTSREADLVAASLRLTAAAYDRESGDDGLSGPVRDSLREQAAELRELAEKIEGQRHRRHLWHNGGS